jgi:hypothetical protein
LSFLIRKFRHHVDFAGVMFSPGVLRSLRELPDQELLDEGRQSWEKQGLMPLLEMCYQSIVESGRRTPDILAEADVRALENRVALTTEGQQMAHEQVILAAQKLRDELPRHKIKPLAGRQEVPTRVLDEDTYPVGGYSSISTRGSIESLLHSQLAYMEPVVRPDLFDIKYLRDELFFYSRDENQFLRRRRTFVLVFYPDLVRARRKDPESRFQRIVFVLGLIYAAVAKLTEWLSTDALKFDFIFLNDGQSLPLAHEFALLQMLFREQIENKSVEIFPVVQDGKQAGAIGEVQLADHCRQRSGRSQCHCLLLSNEDHHLEIDDTVVTRLVLKHLQPSLGHAYENEPFAMDDWAPALERLLQIWI